MKLTVSRFIDMLLKTLFLVACLMVLSSFHPYQRLWQVSQLQPFSEWFQINWQDQAVGWANTRLKIQQQYFVIQHQEVFEGRVRGKRLKFNYQNTLYFARQEPFRLIKGHAQLNEPNLVMNTEFSNNSDVLTIKQKRNQQTKNYQETPVNYNLNDYLSVRQFIESKPDKHQTLNYSWLDPHSLQLIPSEFEVKKTPKGRHQRYVLINKSFSIINHSTAPLSMSFDLSGYPTWQQRDRGMQLIASEGKPSLNPEMQRDLYASNGLRLKQPLGNVDEIKTLSVKLDSGSLNWFKVHPSAVTKDNILTLSSGAYRKASNQALQHWLFYVPNDDIVSIMPVIENATTLSTVHQLVHFTHDFLYYQPTPSSFTVDEVVANGYGDCTEYSQLLLALLNAAKIPAREVNGYIYLGDDEQRFGGHAWVEVLIDGKWIGVDPTWDLLQLTAAHLPITLDQGKSASDLVFSVEQIHYKHKLNR